MQKSLLHIPRLSRPQSVGARSWNALVPLMSPLESFLSSASHGFTHIYAQGPQHPVLTLFLSHMSENPSLLVALVFEHLAQV